MFFSSLVMTNFIVDMRADLYGNHYTISVTRGPKPSAPPNRNATNDKNDDTKPICSVFVAFFGRNSMCVQQQLAVT